MGVGLHDALSSGSALDCDECEPDRSAKQALHAARTLRVRAEKPR